MPCYHPLKGFQIGYHESGKPKYLITSNDVDFIYLNPADDHWHQVLKSEKFLNVGRRNVVSDYKEIPCGRCIGCRLEYSRQWAMRIMAESMSHEHSYFVTLTYSDDNIPRAESITEDGEILSVPTLVKKDVSKFIKDIRNAEFYKFNKLKFEYESKGLSFDKKEPHIRFFASGEYGSKTNRPHYHMILFGLELEDLVFYKKTDLGFNLFNSDYLDSKWKKGYCVIGELTFESAAYTTRYILKKQYGVESCKSYTNLNVTPPFSLMSRRPGIGLEFYEENKERLYKESALYFPTSSGNFRITSTRYYDKHYEFDDPEDFERIKFLRDERRESKELLRSMSCNNDFTTLSKDKYGQLLDEESVILNKTRILKGRDFE